MVFFSPPLGDFSLCLVGRVFTHVDSDPQQHFNKATKQNLVALFCLVSCTFVRLNNEIHLKPTSKHSAYFRTAHQLFIIQKCSTKVQRKGQPTGGRSGLPWRPRCWGPCRCASSASPSPPPAPSSLAGATRAYTGGKTRKEKTPVSDRSFSWHLKEGAWVLAGSKWSTSTRKTRKEEEEAAAEKEGPWWTAGCKSRMGNHNTAAHAHTHPNTHKSHEKA